MIKPWLLEWRRPGIDSEGQWLSLSCYSTMNRAKRRRDGWREHKPDLQFRVVHRDANVTNGCLAFSMELGQDRTSNQRERDTRSRRGET